MACTWQSKAFIAVLALLLAAGLIGIGTAQTIANWRLNETTAGAVIDSVGGFNGTNNGASINAVGRFGAAYDFDGVNDFINIGNLPAFNFNYNTPFSVSAWVRRDNTSTRAIIGKINPNSPFDGWVVAQREPTPGFVALDFSLGASDLDRLLVDSTVQIPNGSLAHVTVTYDGSANANGVKMYLNGLPVTTSITRNNSLGTAINAQPVTISSYAGANRYFDGLIDDVGVYNAALSYAQVRSIYMHGVAGFVAGAPGTIASYDGSYAPDSTTPPVGQTTWTVTTTNGTPVPTPNSPTAGIARFADTNTNGRVAINDPLSDTPIHGSSWFYDFRARLDASVTSNPVVVGVRDEGATAGTTGRTVMLGWSPTTNQLGFYDSPTTALLTTISTTNFADGNFHDYRVQKFGVDGDYKVQVFIDGIAQFAQPLDYESVFPVNSNFDNGFGFFSSTPGTSNFVVDYLTLNLGAPLAVIPEPSTIAVWLVSGLTGAVIARRRRRTV